MAERTVINRSGDVLYATKDLIILGRLDGDVEIINLRAPAQARQSPFTIATIKSRLDGQTFSLSSIPTEPPDIAFENIVMDVLTIHMGTGDGPLYLKVGFSHNAHKWVLFE